MRAAQFAPELVRKGGCMNYPDEGAWGRVRRQHGGGLRVTIRGGSWLRRSAIRRTSME
ncbi:hypothetical protein FRC07_011395, partial [Ceratobasidium sp. 392]